MWPAKTIVIRARRSVCGRCGCPGPLLGPDEQKEGVSGGVSQHIQRLAVVVGAVVQQGGPEFFGAPPAPAWGAASDVLARTASGGL